MRLQTYLQAERGRAATVARALQIPAAWLSQMSTGVRPIPERLGAALELACEMQVRRWDEWPMTWHLIWPELASVEGAPIVVCEEARNAA
jgi:DNA-binding transcriptional regulator YdaS (Cro superfamily)